MDLKNLLGKLDIIEGTMASAEKNPAGPKYTGQWKGTDAGTPGTKMVGGDEQQESILKDLSKGKKSKSKEQELSEEFQAFLEAEFKDTVDKRPARKNARPARGHEPESGYKTIKTDEGVPYKATNPHPALQDPIVAKVVKQMRPGLTGLDMNNEAFLYFAYEIGKMRAREMWEDYGPAIKYFYQSGIGVNEGWESGPEEYQEPYDDADDAYDRQRQEKIDTEAEKEWAKLPKVSTYKLSGRGPNMEPNYEFGDEFDTLEQALKYREELMKDPSTPHPEHIGIRTLTRVVDKDQTNEAIYTAPRNREEYDAKMQALQDLQTDRNNVGHKDLQDRIAMYLANLEKLAVQKGWKQTQPAEESRGHKIIATKLKNLERERKFASGELKIPTPQERQAELKAQEKPKKQVKEFVANNNVTPYGQPTQPKTDPKQAQAVAQATQTIKTATGSSAPTTNIAKAIDAASQGKPVGQADMKALEPVMKDVATIAQDPKLASQFKTLAQQVNQAQLKQKQQQNQQQK